MNTTKHRLFVMVVVILLASSCRSGVGPVIPRAERGVLDLRDWDFQHDGVLSLTGEWAFYWEQFVEAQTLAAEGVSLTGYVDLPAAWNGYDVEGTPLSGPGYATYRLTLLLDASSTAPLAFKVPEFETAYALYVDEQLVSSNGTVAKTAEIAKPQWLPRVASFTAGEQEIEILLQISNFHHRKGGAGQVILLGEEGQIRQVRESRLSAEFLVLGSLFIMGLYHAGLFAFRRKDSSPLYFGACCILMAARVLVTGEYYLSQLIPGINWDWVVRLNYLSFGFTPPLFVAYTRVLYRDISASVQRAFRLGAIVFGFIVLVTPPRIFTHVLLPYQVFIVFVTMFLCYGLLVAFRYKRPGINTYLIGFGVLFGAMINDILHNNHIIRTGYIGPLGTWAFVLVQALLLSRRFSSAFSQVESLSQELEQRVIVRTQRLAAVAAELTEAKALAEERSAAAEASSQAKSVFLANMSHELHTPLNAVMGFAQLMVDAPNLTTEQRENLEIVGQSGAHLLAIINNALEMSKVAGGWTESHTVAGLPDESAPSVLDDTKMSTGLTAAIQLQPAEWQAALRQATIEGDSEWLATLVRQVQSQDDQLGTQLTAWIEAFDYKRILSLTEESNPRSH